MRAVKPSNSGTSLPVGNASERVYVPITARLPIASSSKPGPATRRPPMASKIECARPGRDCCSSPQERRQIRPTQGARCAGGVSVSPLLMTNFAPASVVPATSPVDPCSSLQSRSALPALCLGRNSPNPLCHNEFQLGIGSALPAFRQNLPAKNLFAGRRQVGD
jgi:hypothetical protein